MLQLSAHLTYTLNFVLKKIVQVLLLAIGLVITGHAVLTPMLMVIVMITGAFLAMSLITDRVRAIADAKYLASRQDYDGRGHSGRLLSRVLCGGPSGR
jgi:hypothetical protein